MAYLRLVKGTRPGESWLLGADRSVLGRSPACQVVIESAAVSRHHAQIVQQGGEFLVEDLNSRNGTALNDLPVRGRIALRDGDQLRLCDHLFEFTLRAPARGKGRFDDEDDRPDVRLEAIETLEEEYDPGERQRTFDRLAKSISSVHPESSSIITTLNALDARHSATTGARPEVKLKAVLEIGAALGRVLAMDDVLRTILEQLLRVFPAADHGFVLLKRPQGDLHLNAALSRREDEEDEIPLSLTIVHQALEGKQAILSADAHADSRFDHSASIQELRMRSVMCAPLLTAAGDGLGVLQISTNDLTQSFTSDDLELLASVCAQAALAVENATLHEAILQQREMERELELATQVQLGFLPKHRPRVPGFELTDYYEPAHHIGGDYFDYIPLPDGRIGLAIGDVAGKGISAALLMARLSAGVRYHLLSAPSPAAALERLNRELLSNSLGFRFVTLIVAVLDPATRRLVMANAGHLPPILKRSDGTAASIATTESGMPLGLAPANYEFHDLCLPMEPGQSLTFFTDGATEATNVEHRVFGSKRLLEVVRSSSSSPNDVILAIVRAMERFCKGSTHRDDVCLMSIHCVAPSEMNDDVSRLVGEEHDAQTNTSLPLTAVGRKIAAKDPLFSPDGPT